MTVPKAEFNTLARALARLLLSAWERLPATALGPEHGEAAGDQQAAPGTEVRDVDAQRPLCV